MMRPSSCGTLALLASVAGLVSAVPNGNTNVDVAAEPSSTANAGGCDSCGDDASCVAGFCVASDVYDSITSVYGDVIPSTVDLSTISLPSGLSLPGITLPTDLGGLGSLTLPSVPLETGSGRLTVTGDYDSAVGISAGGLPGVASAASNATVTAITTASESLITSGSASNATEPTGVSGSKQPSGPSATKTASSTKSPSSSESAISTNAGSHNGVAQVGALLLTVAAVAGIVF